MAFPPATMSTAPEGEYLMAGLYCADLNRLTRASGQPLSAVDDQNQDIGRPSNYDVDTDAEAAGGLPPRIWMLGPRSASLRRERSYLRDAGVDVDVSDVKELHYITPIVNLPSILEHGILSHKLVAGLRHESVAMLEIQGIRASVRVPRGRPLHEYANLYFNARNPMMFKRSSRHRELCVLRIRPDVLQLEGVVITDQNAASSYRRWGSFPEALARIDLERLFAE
jgi:hypothetical protein